jgi:hypothetical protein
MGGQGLGDRQVRTIGGRRKASEIEKKHAIGASPREGTSTPGRRQKKWPGPFSRLKEA